MRRIYCLIPTFAIVFLASTVYAESAKEFVARSARIELKIFAGKCNITSTRTMHVRRLADGSVPTGQVFSRETLTNWANHPVETKSWTRAFDINRKIVRDTYPDNTVIWTSPGATKRYTHVRKARGVERVLQVDRGVWPHAFPDSLACGGCWATLRSCLTHGWSAIDRGIDATTGDRIIEMQEPAGGHGSQRLWVNTRSGNTVEKCESDGGPSSSETSVSYQFVNGVYIPTQITSSYYDHSLGYKRLAREETMTISAIEANPSLSNQDLELGPIPKDTLIVDSRFDHEVQVVQGDRQLTDADMLERSGRKDHRITVEPGALQDVLAPSQGSAWPKVAWVLVLMAALTAAVLAGLHWRKR